MHMNPLHVYRHICSDTLYVHTDPDSLPSFAEECIFGIWSSDSLPPLTKWSNGEQRR